ncbi:MarR family winged helix-turn-helix transcriptional regulator [Paenibacillus sp. GCM10028914]|uniref:MarR family winged helix-turn-helix transcriptional regulator n=1 Tax=Paenibacillus sp. GCM10028914 TaxID=3273416 RepID=UPI003614AB82
MNLSTEEIYGYSLTKTSRSILRFLTVHLKSYSITPEQWTVLKRVYENDGIRQKELSTLADKDPATLAKILDILERDQIIIRKMNHTDRRSYFIFITEKGTELRNAIYIHLEEVFKQILEGISNEELTIFTKVLQQFEKNAINDMGN